MKQFLYTIIIIHTFFTACTTSPKQIYERYGEFPETIPLTGDIIPLDTALFRYPFRIAVRENIAIIQDLHNIDHYLHAFSFPEWTHLVSFAPRGEGPEEMIICETFQFNSLDSLWTLDPNKMVIHRYEIVPDEKSATLAEVIPVQKELLRSLDLAVTPDGFIVPDYTGEYRYHLLNRQGNLVQSGGHIPTEEKGDLSVATAQGWRPFFDFNEEKGILAMATQLGEVIEIFDLADTTHIVKYGPLGAPLFSVHDGNGYPEGIMGFVDIQVTGQYIYAVFEGTWFSKKLEFYAQNIKPVSGGNQIYVFDFKGNPVRKYLLDHYIYSLDVHEDEGLIYALDLNQDEPVVRFRL
ncbi:MAG: TolB-like 6-bladed beta-propeller domain-containing protein [Tannerellaceae bacterium]|nr:TolB-like 6-bladed beta-propeller domain-containing protein [Tannerellaceae bacterium]